MKRRARFPIAFSFSLALTLGLIVVVCGCSLQTPTPTPLPTPTVPPREGELPATEFAQGSAWTTGAKTGVGTAFTYDQPESGNTSRVWFTITNGALTDVLYPQLDRPNIREVKFFVGDGQKVYDQTTDLRIRITRPDVRALYWEMEATDREGRFRLSTSIVADPEADTLLVAARLDALKGLPSDYQLYAYLVPLLGGTGRGNKLTLNYREHTAAVTGEGAAAFLATDVNWLGATAGYLREKDGLTDLQDNGRLTLNYDAATAGDYPTLMVQLPADKPATLALGLGANQDAARAAARASIGRGYNAIRLRYIAGWQRYCATLDPLDGNATAEYYLSAMLLRAGEDKTIRGAVVASFAVPWSDHSLDRPENRANFAGYRRVWARDAYHTALGLWAAGDMGTALAILRYIDDRQQDAAGVIPQNSYLDGSPSSTGTQMDEAAVPILLAWRLGAADRYESLVKPAADLILQQGPRTQQERWEETGGYSPATIAAEVAGLVAAGDLAQRAGDAASARNYRLFADRWAMEIGLWTYTHSGPLPGAQYFLRISPEGKPDTPDVFTIANGGRTVDQRAVVDPSFLELVRLGVYRPNDTAILNTLKVVDQALRVQTPNGPAWYRYSGDRYGEQDRGDLLLAKGRPWPLLAGERGVYELAAGRRDQAEALLHAMEKFANDGGLISEQVWEDTGEGTGSATPLLWAHAEYIVLLKSLVVGTVVDRPQIVFDRFNR